MRRRRILNADPDGMADVVVLGNPIPRHLSIVDFGANGRVASTWKSSSEQGPDLSMLRAPPSATLLEASRLDIKVLSDFSTEVMSAWRSIIVEILSMDISAEDRASRVRSVSTQASARIAALASYAATEMIPVVKSTNSVDLGEAPKAQGTHLDAEMDRRTFIKQLDEAVAWTPKAVVESLRGATPENTVETVLAVIESVSDVFIGWAGALPDGRIGVLPTGEQKSTPPPSSETDMLTIEDLAKLAEGDPKGFLTIVHNAFQAVKTSHPTEAKKFAFGDTGVDAYDTNAVINAIRGITDGDMLLQMIATAVGGVDLERAMANATPQVASSMKSVIDVRDGLARFVTAELKRDPQGALASEIRTIVAGSVAEAISGTLKAFLDDGARTEATPSMLSFEIGDDFDVNSVLRADIPQL